MLYQLSYTPVPEMREVASEDGRRKGHHAPSPSAASRLLPLPRGERGYWRMMGSPIQVPSEPWNTRWVAGR